MMPNAKHGFRRTVFAVVFTALAGAALLPAFGIISYGFPAASLFWLLAGPVLGFVVLIAVILWLVAALRPR